MRRKRKGILGKREKSVVGVDVRDGERMVGKWEEMVFWLHC
jgi:phosphoribosylformimino-5-aminoimidazole carboxamide ribonucleotide (ProFAR) isomerase